jgi:hypothetical protein
VGVRRFVRKGLEGHEVATARGHHRWPCDGAGARERGAPQSPVFLRLAAKKCAQIKKKLPLYYSTFLLWLRSGLTLFQNIC